MQNITVAAATIELQDGEHYAGLSLNADGTPSHHLVLLPEATEHMPWTQARKSAQAKGGTLPTRSEQTLLFANLKREFTPGWYWSDEEHKGDGSYAWLQVFPNGYQGNSPKSYEGRCRAVRRLTA